MSRFFLVAVLVVGLFSVNSAHAQITPLGTGLTCNGSTIFKGNRVVKFSKAKSNLKNTIAALKKSLVGASKAKKAKINAKIKAARSTQILISACNKGQLASSVDPIFTSLSGLYSGKYQGIVSGFIPVSGDISAAFAILPGTTTFTGQLSFGGELNAALNNKPLDFSGDVGGIAFPAKFVIQDTFLGEVTAEVSQTGNFTVTSTGITLDSQLSGSTISGTLNGSYSGVPFSGSFSMSK